MRVRIQTQDGHLFTIDIQEQWTILQVITTIRDALQQNNTEINPTNTTNETKNEIKTNNTRIRLLYQGKMLVSSSIVSDIGLQEDSYIHCMVTEINESLSSRAVVLPTEADEQHGFGVLVNASFSIDEIEVIRLTYFPQVVEYSSRQPTNPREDPHHRWLRLEEEWMQLEVRNVASEFYTNVGRNAILRNPTFTFDTRETNNTTNTNTNINTNTNTNTSLGTSHPSTNVLSSEMAPDAAREQALQILHNVQRHMDAAQPRPRRPGRRRNNINNGNNNATINNGDIGNEAGSTRSGTNSDFVIGFGMGFVLGVIMLFWLGENSLTKKQKAGLICGVAINMLMQLFSQTDSDSTSKHLRGFQTSSNRTAEDFALDSEHSSIGSRLIPVEEVTGHLPLSGVSSVHYNAKMSKKVPNKFG